MVPIMFEWSATSFTTNGLGRLVDCISCKVTEERNSIYECEFQYPITGEKYDLIEIGNIIVVSHDESGDLQPFEIYRRSAPLRGVVTFNAHHLSYRLNNTILKPFTANGVVNALSKFETEVLTEQQFSFWTDKTADAVFTLATPATARSMLGGVSGSILDVYGGEYEWDNFTVKLHLHRGANNGVTIRYGKNLVNLNEITESLDKYNAVIPFWKNEEGVVVYGGLVSAVGGFERNRAWTDEHETTITDENGTQLEFYYFQSVPNIMDLSSEFETEPTPQELESRAATLLARSAPWMPSENLTVDFVALWQTENYKDFAPLERVKLCDVVTIIYEELGVNATAKVNRVVWDALIEKYSSIELGDTQASLSQTVSGSTQNYISSLPTVSMMDNAINAAFNVLSGQAGGNIAFLFDALQRPTAILVMDTESVETANNVLRLNSAGIAVSANGVNGLYRYIYQFADNGLRGDVIENQLGTKWARMAAALFEAGYSSEPYGTLDLAESNNGNIDASLKSHFGSVNITGAEEASVTGKSVNLNASEGGVNVQYGGEPQGIAIGGDSVELAAVKKMYLEPEEEGVTLVFVTTDGESYAVHADHR